MALTIRPASSDDSARLLPPCDDFELSLRRRGKLFCHHDSARKPSADRQLAGTLCNLCLRAGP
jgi:hypothetical protein